MRATSLGPPATLLYGIPSTSVGPNSTLQRRMERQSCQASLHHSASLPGTEQMQVCPKGKGSEWREGRSLSTNRYGHPHPYRPSVCLAPCFHESSQSLTSIERLGTPELGAMVLGTVTY